MDGLDLNVWPCHPHGSWQRALAHKAMGLPVDDEDAKALAAWDKEGKNAHVKQSRIKQHRQYMARVAAAARSHIEPREVVGCFELARRVAGAPDMPARGEVVDVLKSLKPGRSYGGLTKRYIDNLSGHPGHFLPGVNVTSTFSLHSERPTGVKLLGVSMLGKKEKGNTANGLQR